MPDYCILIYTPGTDWCGSLSGAVMWPQGQPDAAEPIVSDEEPPRGCVCMNDGEGAALEDEAPADEHAALVAEIDTAARQACVDLVPEGYDHNCYVLDEVPLTPPLPGPPSDACIGSCQYANDPPFGEPCGDPDPWECNDGSQGHLSEVEIR